MHQTACVDGNKTDAQDRKQGHAAFERSATASAHGCGRQIQADDGYNRTRDDRRHQLFNPTDTGCHHNQTDDGVNNAAYDDAAQSNRNVGIGTGPGNIAGGRDDDTDEGKRGTEVTRDVSADD